MSEDKITIRTNNVPRPVIYGYELSPKERAEFDYYDWDKVERGEESCSFFRYKGQLYDLGEFTTTSGMPEFNPLVKWAGYCSDTFFSGLVVKYADNQGENIIIGTFYA